MLAQMINVLARTKNFAHTGCEKLEGTLMLSLSGGFLRVTSPRISPVFSIEVYVFAQNIA